MPRSLLLTQCLQNDFVKPVDRFDPLPNQLHVGYAESQRLMGENPAEGPVVRINPRKFGTNLDRYLAMRDYLATHFGDGAYIDLRFRDRIAFRPLRARGH